MDNRRLALVFFGIAVLAADPALAFNELFLEMVTRQRAPHSDPDDYIYYGCAAGEQVSIGQMSLDRGDRARRLMAYTQVDTCAKAQEVNAGNITVTPTAPLLSIENLTRARINGTPDSLSLGTIRAGNGRLQGIGNRVRATMER